MMDLLLDSDLTERYNAGLCPPPSLPEVPARLPYPAWRPTPAQVQAARQNLGRNLALLVFLGTLGLLALALLFGWRP